jgi:hypothetical protein
VSDICVSLVESLSLFGASTVGKEVSSEVVVVLDRGVFSEINVEFERDIQLYQSNISTTSVTVLLTKYIC